MIVSSLAVGYFQPLRLALRGDHLQRGTTLDHKSRPRSGNALIFTADHCVRSIWLCAIRRADRSARNPMRIAARECSDHEKLWPVTRALTDRLAARRTRKPRKAVHQPPIATKFRNATECREGRRPTSQLEMRRPRRAGESPKTEAATSHTPTQSSRKVIKMTHGTGEASGLRLAHLQT